MNANLREQLQSFERPGASLPRRNVDGIGGIQALKLEMVHGAVGTKSIRDFGGLYLVHGRYLLEPAVALKCTFASMVDVTPRAEWETKKREAQQRNVDLEVELKLGDFREPALYDKLAEVDTSILYEVILHQENYVEVIRNVARKTKQYICFASPCLREELSPLPCAAALLQFYDNGLKDILRQESFWPEEPAVATFSTRYWMWGHTTSHILSLFSGFGWDLEDGVVIDNSSGTYWEYPVLRFKKR